MASALWARYEEFLDRYPLLGRSLTAATIAGASDATVQSMAMMMSPSSSSGRRRQRATFQARRVALWFLYGGLFSGPVGHGWQKLLGCYFAPKKKKGRKLKEDDDDRKNLAAAAATSSSADEAAAKSRELALRVAADAFIFGPFCNAVAISFIALALEKKPPASLPGALRTSLPLTQLRAWRFWPLVSLLAYSRVPPKMRVPFFNCAGFLWGVILISGTGKGKGNNGKR